VYVFSASYLVLYCTWYAYRGTPGNASLYSEVIITKVLVSGCPGTLNFTVTQCSTIHCAVDSNRSLLLLAQCTSTSYYLLLLSNLKMDGQQLSTQQESVGTLTPSYADLVRSTDGSVVSQ